MNTTFWLLESPHNQKLAILAGDTQFEKVICPANEGHRRPGRRLGDLSVTVDPSGIKDFTWTWSSDVLLSERVLDVFLKHRVTGYEIKPTVISFPKRNTEKPPAMFELIITGWAGMASSAAGLSVVKSCSACNSMTYTIAGPSRLIDPAAWDGSDLFIVWPLPRYPFLSDRLAKILREERMTGVKLVKATDIPFEPGNQATPGRLRDWMSDSRARALGRPLGLK